MKRIRVIIADDSSTMRRVLAAALKGDPSIEVVGEATDGPEAVAVAKSLRPDVMTMDIQMPGLSGFDAISTIMATVPVPIVVVASADNRVDVDLSFRAMAAGALEVITKPGPENGLDFATFGKQVCRAVRLMAEVPVVTRRRSSSSSIVPTPPSALGAQGSEPVNAPPPAWATRVVAIEIIGIAASTGGPAALATILRALPGTLGVPIVVAQHVAAGFCDGLVRWLAENTALKVEMARHDAVAQRGHVYVADAGVDVEVHAGFRLHTRASESGHSPSGDRLLHSLAKTFGAAACGVVLTGMGEDGARGLLALRQAGGSTIGQDAATSVVYGMPNVAMRLGAVEAQLPLHAIGPALINVVAATERPLR